MNDYQFGNFVCRLREQKNMTQAELARMLGVTPAAVSKWENGSSKPRTEVLFRLAEILGVRPEELMAGHLIENPTLDPEVVKQINERYEHLQKVEVCNRSDAKLKRILAWLVDWFTIGMTAGFLASGLDLIRQGSSPDHSGPILFLMLLAMLSFPACFIFRELIFGGRSLGKRITKLEILDQATGKPASKKQRIIRSLFFFLSYIDGVAVLVSGLSVGDRVAHTVVVPLSALVPGEKHTPEQINRYASPKSSRKKVGADHLRHFGSGGHFVRCVRQLYLQRYGIHQKIRGISIRLCPSCGKRSTPSAGRFPGGDRLQGLHPGQRNPGRPHAGHLRIPLLCKRADLSGHLPQRKQILGVVRGVHKFQLKISSFFRKPLAKRKKI